MECIRLDKLDLALKSSRYFLAISEYFRASCTLIKLRLRTIGYGFSKVENVLQSLHTLVRFELDASLGSSVGTFQTIPQSCPLLTHFTIMARLSKEDIPVIVDDVCANQALTHLGLHETGICNEGAKFLQRVFKKMPT